MTNYTRRRTGDFLSDTGSTQICSTFEDVRNPVFSRVRGFWKNRLEQFGATKRHSKSSKLVSNWCQNFEVKSLINMGKKESMQL